MSKTRMEKQIVVRVNDDLLEALQQDAESNGRTLAQTVRFQLGRTLLHPAHA